MPLFNFSMLDQSSIVMHIVQRNRFTMLTILKICDKRIEEKKCTVVHPRFTSVLFLWESYKCHTSSSSRSEKTNDYSALCRRCSPSAWRGRLVFYLLLCDTWLFYFLWSGSLSHMWLSGHQFYYCVELFLIRCDIHLCFHRPIDPCRGKGDYSDVALNPIRMIC